jgi:hypothetical protein
MVAAIATDKTVAGNRPKVTGAGNRLCRRLGDLLLLGLGGIGVFGICQQRR